MVQNKKSAKKKCTEIKSARKKLHKIYPREKIVHKKIFEKNLHKIQPRKKNSAQKNPQKIILHNFQTRKILCIQYYTKKIR